MIGVGDLIRTEPPLRFGATAVYPRKLLWEKKYRFESRFGDEVLLHQVAGDEIHLPRGLCPIGPHDERADGLPALYPVTAPEPRPNQVEVFQETLRFLGQGLSGIVNAYTGWGKTVLGYHAFAHLGVKTLVVATKDDIFKQWIDGAVEMMNLPREKIGVIRGDKVQVAGKEFVVAMIHSLAKPGRLPAKLAREFGLVIFDEVHRVPAETFSVVASLLPAKLRLGLSADETRSDGKELLIYAHIGPVRAATQVQLMVPKVLRFRSNWRCPRVIRTQDDGTKKVIRRPHEPGRTTEIEKAIAADDARNALLAEIIEEAYGKDRKVVVFSTLHDHLHAIHDALRKRGVKAGQIGFYLGAQTKADREERERQKVRPILLTTFSMMGEGTNIPWLDTGVMAMPRADVEQPCGRIRREHAEKKDPVWIDVIDADSPVFHGYAVSRLDWYRQIKATVKDIG